MERGYKLKDRPEFKSKPQPITFKKTDTCLLYTSDAADE